MSNLIFFFKYRTPYCFFFLISVSVPFCVPLQGCIGVVRQLAAAVPTV